MVDPYCSECAKQTGGCWQHNGSGIYIIDHEGMRMTHMPDRIQTDTGWLYYLKPIVNLGS